MVFYTVEPEVAGELGPGTVFDRSTTPVAIEHLEYVFSDWLGDPIVESTPCFLVTAELAEQLRQAGLTGFVLAEAEVTLSPEVEELIGRPWPAWQWFKPTGTAYTDDFGVNGDLLLVVSDKALGVLRDGGMERAEVGTE